MTYNSFRMLGAALAIAAVASSPLDARELRVSSFEPAQGFFSAKILTPWIERLSAKMSDETQLKLYPGSILGAPPSQQELVRNGVADVALVVPTYTPGLFPRTSIVEIPYLASNAAEGTEILQSLADEGLLGGEYEDFKVIGLFTTHSYNVISDAEIRTPDQMQGLKVRTPSPFMSTLAEMVGAAGVSIPAPQVYENLERGVVDAALWNFDAYKTFRLFEPSPRVTIIDASMSPMAILMNKQTYESLPEADRALIDADSGRTFSEWAAGVVDAYDAEQRKALVADGRTTLTELTEEEAGQWRQAFKGASEKWITGTVGLDPEEGRSVLKRAHEIVDEQRAN